MFGLDVANFFTVKGAEASHWLLLPQGWSLGTELLFYLLVPYIAKLRTAALIGIAVLSLAVRLCTLDLPFYPWQQKFFPSELMFFVIGLLAYRHQVKIHGVAAITISAALIAFSGHLGKDPNLYGSLLLAAVLFATIPAAFNLTKHSAVDRFIGEFSYPVYLWQVLVLSIYGYHPLTLLWCVLLSLPMVLFVERPMEAWRKRVLERPIKY